MLASIVQPKPLPTHPHSDYAGIEIFGNGHFYMIAVFISTIFPGYFFRNMWSSHSILERPNTR